MMKNLLILNCDEEVIERLKVQLGEGIQVRRCRDFDDLQAAWSQYHNSRIIVGCNGKNGLATGGEESRFEMRMAAAAHEPPVVVIPPPECIGRTLADQVDWFERQVITRTLAMKGQHRKETAAELGISRVTLYNKMKKFGLLDS